MVSALRGHREGSKIALALSKSQRGELSELLGSEDLVDDIALAVAGYKAESRRAHIPDVEIARHLRALNAAAERCLALSKHDAMTFGFGDLDRHVRRAATGDKSFGEVGLREIRAALDLLARATESALGDATVKKIGRPAHPTQTLFWSVQSAVYRSGAQGARTVWRVFRIALAACGLDEDQIEKTVDAQRKSGRRKRTKAAKKWRGLSLVRRLTQPYDHALSFYERAMQ